MKSLVCVSKTPDTTSKISFTNDQSALDTGNIQFIMNPYDEWYALVRALELQEAQGGSVTLINVGPAANDAIIRKGLAIGAEKAIRIEADPQSALFVAKQIAGHAKAENYDIIFLGKETIDYNGSEVGGMIAELLDLPFISYASHLEMNGNTATIHRDIEGGTEVVEVETPFVVSAAKGLAEQRIPNMRGIMMAKSKPLQVIQQAEAGDLAVAVHFEAPPPKKAVTLVDPENMEELVRLLHEEAKVI
ncbi:MAG TPA: electron transfer flavoprotein subunit beta/FixA family protein [Flavilitoribacter sp.]|nr:electron transfer flavoprotein subunit beta/FixA family protein [Flavilitoribacter sp.]